MIPVGLIAAAGGYILFVSESTAKQLEDEVRLCREVGLAVTAADLRKNPPTYAENAAGHYQLAITRLALIPKDDRWFPSGFVGRYGRSDPHSAYSKRVRTAGSEDAALESSLKSWGLVFAAIDDAVKRPRLDFNRRWEHAGGCDFREGYYIREFAQAICAAAYLAARRGDDRTAIVRLREVRAMAMHSYQEPTFSAQHRGLEIMCQFQEGCILVAQAGAKDSKLPDQILELLRAPALPKVRQALNGEAYLALAIPEETANMPAGIVDSQGETALMRIGSLRRTVELFAIRNYRQAYLEMPEDGRDWKASQNALNALFQRITYPQSISDQFASARVGDSIYAVHDAFIRTVARQRIAMAACLTYGYKGRMGAFPRELPKTAIDLSDPYTGKPIIYRVTKLGIQLRCLGPDGKDDNQKLGDDIALDVDSDPMRGFNR